MKKIKNNKSIISEKRDNYLVDELEEAREIIISDNKSDAESDSCSGSGCGNGCTGSCNHCSVSK